MSVRGDGGYFVEGCYGRGSGRGSGIYLCG